MSNGPWATAMNPIRIIKLVIIAAAVGMGTGVGWAWTDFATEPLRVKIANARSNQASGNQVPVPTQPLPSHPAQVSMNAIAWNLQISEVARLPAPIPAQRVGEPPPSVLPPRPAPAWQTTRWLLFPTPQGGWSFDYPSPTSTHRPQFSYFESTTASPLLSQGWYVKMSGRASPSPLGMDCRVYFSGSRSDDVSGQYYRWLSTKPLIHGANWPGNFVQFVGFEPEFWSTVTGERGDASAAATAGFQQALANPQSIGIICGADDPFAGDSIPAPYGGDHILQFTMDSFAVCDPFAPSAKQQNEACATPSAQQR
jgi:hypothetical protein